MAGNHAFYAGLFVVVTCAILNLAGIRVVGFTSLWLFFLLSLPFALVVVLSPLRMGALATEPHVAASGAGVGVLGAVMVAMWNYMGWDNASTIAQEVGAPAENLPEGDDRCGNSGFVDLHLPFIAVYFTGVPARRLPRKVLGQPSRDNWADR